MWFREKIRFLSVHWDRFSSWFRHWMFRWVQDDEGDIGLEVLGLITFVKYKENTIVEWFKCYYRDAGKWQCKGDPDPSYQEIKEVAEHWNETEEEN